MDLKEKKEKLTSLLQFVEKTEAKERQNLNLLAQKKLEIKAQLSLIEEILSTKSAPTAWPISKTWPKNKEKSMKGKSVTRK